MDALQTISRVGILEVLKLRAGAMKITGSKLLNALASVDPDGRLRDLHVYFAAHTGRYGGRRLQIQNLPKGVSANGRGSINWPALFASPITYERVKGVAEALGVGFSDVLSTLIRPMFVARDGYYLAVADYSAVELRGVAWLAGEKKLLESLASGKDAYVELASRLYKKPEGDITKDERWVAKQTLLGCGYSMSDIKFNLQCAGYGVNLEERGVSAKECVELFRNTYPAIAGHPVEDFNGRTYRAGGLWHKYGAAIRDVVSGAEVEVATNKCVFTREGKHLLAYLPSGRPIVYRNAHMTMEVPGYAARLGLKMEKRPTVRYVHPRYGSTVLFGGKVTENVCQGTCGDILKAAQVECERHAPLLNTVFHVHDEIVSEVPKDRAREGLEALERVMSTAPAWAAGFPLAVEGYLTPRYIKTPWPGELT